MSKLFWKRHASTILTCVGAVGVVATSVLAVKATPKAMRLLEQAKEEKGEDLTVLETVNVAGPAYIPAVATGVATVACIFGANAFNKRQQASLMSAYALLDRAHKDYTSKVTEMLGEEVDAEIKEEIARDKYKNTDISVKGDKELFFDYVSMRYFESTMSEVLNAEHKLRQHFAMTGYASMNEFYDYLGLEPNDYYDLGWSSGAGDAWYGYDQILFEHEKSTVGEDNLECWIISMPYEPTPDYCMY